MQITAGRVFLYNYGLKCYIRIDGRYPPARNNTIIYTKNISGKAAPVRRVSACERDPAANKLSVVVLLLYEMSIRRPWGYAVFILYGAWGADTKGAFQ